MRILTAILGAVFISLTAFAGTPQKIRVDNTIYTGEEAFRFQTKEGFQPSASAVLSNAWENTFAVTDGNETTPKISAAVLIFRKILNGSIHLGFLTSGHSLLKMTKEGQLGSLTVSRNIRMVDKLELIDKVYGDVVDSAVNMNYDLGFFILKITFAEYESFQPLQFSSACHVGRGDQVALIGFPGVFNRSVEDQKQPIMAPNTVTKRVSEGRYTGEPQFGEDQVVHVNPLMGTTADAMIGSSGGPALTRKGELVGILVGSLAKKSTEYRYMGDDTGRNLKSHSFISNCSTTKIFAYDMWHKFLRGIALHI